MFIVLGQHLRGEMQAAKTYSQLKTERYGRGPRDKAYEIRRMSNPKLAASKYFRNSACWQKFRGWFKKRHPLCCDPFDDHKRQGITQITQHVHHIEEISERPDLATTESNCRGLCTTCHNKVEAMHRAGKPTKMRGAV